MTFVLLPLAHDWSISPIYLLHLTGLWPRAHWRLCIDCLGFWTKPDSHFPVPFSPLLPVVSRQPSQSEGFSFWIQLTRTRTSQLCEHGSGSSAFPNPIVSNGSTWKVSSRNELHPVVKQMMEMMMRILWHGEQTILGFVPTHQRTQYISGQF